MIAATLAATVAAQTPTRELNRREDVQTLSRLEMDV